MHEEDASSAGKPLDVSPITVMEGPPALTPPAKTGGRRRRTGVALGAATGLVVLAAAPFAVLTPHEQPLGDTASSTSKSTARPNTAQEKKQAEKKPGVPVPSWEGRPPSTPVPARPPRVTLSPSPSTSNGPAQDPGKDLVTGPNVTPSAPAPTETPSERSAVRRPPPARRPQRAAHPSPTPTVADLVVNPSRGKAARTKSTPSATATARHAQAAPAQTRVVHGTYRLDPGHAVSTNRISLALRTDGDLVFRNAQGKTVWSTGTHAAGTHAVFQADGNLVLYSRDNATLWSSRTDGHDGAVLVLQADGNLTIRQGDSTLWATGT